MELFRLHAFTVLPQRTTKDKALPLGGSFEITPQLRTILDGLFISSKLANQSMVDFKVKAQESSSERKHPVRTLLMDFAFGTEEEASNAAKNLAQRLADSTDHRSPPCLLIIAAAQSNGERRVTIWAFPRDEAFQLHAGKKPTIKLLNDVFSSTSRLRKAALFQGQKLKTDFWNGRILDLQATGTYGNAADYWIREFLDCRFGLEGEAGTRILADCLRKTWESSSESQDARDQLFSAMTAIRTSPKQTWSLQQFATHYLQGEAKQTFLGTIPNTDLLPLTFSFNRNVFENKLNFRVFRLENDVYVSAPFEAIGNSVTIEEADEQRTLHCEGVIKDEKVRARHA